MKKIFPVIIALISLSLIGIIYIQVKWIESMLIVKEEQFLAKIKKGMEVAGDELMEQRGVALLPRPGKNIPNFNWQNSQLAREVMRPPSIAERFSVFEIHEKLNRAFEQQGLKNLNFEFAVSSENRAGVIGFYEKRSQSPNFEALFEDTINNQLVVYHFLPQSGSIAEGLVPEEHMAVVVPNIKNIVWRSLGWMIAGAVFFTLIIISAFYLTVNTMLRQKKISEIKSDFINNMTHEFKTPLATISLAIDALRTEKVRLDPTKSDYFSGIIKEENKRMNKHVETILQAAITDRQEIQLSLKPLHVNEVIKRTLNKFMLQLNEKNGMAHMQLDAVRDMINGDEVHFSNLISNLIDNALKYSKEELLLQISTQNKGKNIQIRIEDNGIGMSKETVKRIFEKFYRAHTGNIHNVKGFGLGLSYVKSVVDAHGGKIRVDSVPGRGSVFTLEFPVLKKQEVQV